MRGRFISFEGGEGAGKSTQARLLAGALEKLGIATLLTREPGGTPGAETIRRLLLDPPGEGWGARAEALLFAAARADHVARAITPALDAGTWVICDRFVDSSRAYQGGAGGLADADILDLHRIGSSGLLPDLAILLEIPAAVAAERLQRRAGGAGDAIERRGADYHQHVGDTFARLAAAEPNRFVRVIGDGSPEQTHALIMEAVTRLIGNDSRC